jgi:hypothetical protein
MPIHSLSITIGCKTCGTKVRTELPTVKAAGQACETAQLERLVEALIEHRMNHGATTAPGVRPDTEVDPRPSHEQDDDLAPNTTTTRAA